MSSNLLSQLFYVPFTYIPPNQTIPEDEFKVVTLDSPEFRAFVKRIEQNNNENKHKQSACLLCWGEISFYEKRRHQEHSHYTVTPMYFKDERSFLNLAQKHAKYHELPNGTKLVAIFAERCKIVESSYINAPNRSQAFAQTNTKNGGSFGNQTVNEIRQVSQQQINQENQIKRLNSLITALYEECKQKERRIADLEDQMTQMQQLVCSTSNHNSTLNGSLNGKLQSNSVIGNGCTNNAVKVNGNSNGDQLIGAFANKPHTVQNKINLTSCTLTNKENGSGEGSKSNK